jgi:hypothetical protein
MLRDDWPEFVRYKTSEECEERMRRNQHNARQKVYHHKMGSGGYRSAIPKWQRMEADLLAKGIHPFSLEWPECSKNWFFANGESLDPQTRELVIGGKIRIVAQRLIDIVDASASGSFVPNREKDELMYTL